MNELTKPIIVGFPVRGEWSVPNTPGSRIPSHGTNRLGTRYAYDFLQVDWERKGHPCYNSSPLRYFLSGVSVEQCYCYGKEIYSPCAGTIVKVIDHYPERKRLSVFKDLYQAGKNSRFDPSSDDIKMLTGNCVIIKYSDSVYAALCHLRPNSVKVHVGDTVEKGDVLGDIGHSGNSMFPHLHFQMMDSPDMNHTNGLPCAFEEYQIYRDGKWEKIYDGIPKSTDRVLFEPKL